MELHDACLHRPEDTLWAWWGLEADRVRGVERADSLLTSPIQFCHLLLKMMSPIAVDDNTREPSYYNPFRRLLQQHPRL